MKKLFNLFAAAVMTLSLSACVPSDFYTIYQPQQYSPAPAAPPSAFPSCETKKS